MATEYVDLVTDAGELIRIECQNKYTGGLYDSLENSMKRKDWWCPSQFDGCTATYMGLIISRVAMSKIVGML